MAIVVKVETAAGKKKMNLPYSCSRKTVLEVTNYNLVYQIPVEMY